MLTNKYINSNVTTCASVNRQEVWPVSADRKAIMTLLFYLSSLVSGRNSLCQPVEIAFAVTLPYNNPALSSHQILLETGCLASK